MVNVITFVMVVTNVNATKVQSALEVIIQFLIAFTDTKS